MIQTIHGVDELAEIQSPVCLALGVFDGVHVGHQAVIAKAVERANACQGRSVVATFAPHPIQVMAPEKAPRRILASLEHKAMLLQDLGVSCLLVIPFTKEFSAKPAEEFVMDLLRANLWGIAVGEDWKFGKGRRGDGDFLLEMGRQYAFSVDLVPAVLVDDVRVSSTRIRQVIDQGHIDQASTLLGRAYSVMGKVVQGRQLGRTIGFPTANIEVHGEQLPPSGVWSVTAWIDGEWKAGIANLGKRPTVEQGEIQRLLEVFIFDWHGDLYGKDLEIRFDGYVREEKQFNGVDELKAQIAQDVIAVKGSL